MIVEYDSNNSGGNFWLSKDDWKNLTEVGWKITRHFGSFPTCAEKEFNSIEEAKEEFEELTGQDCEATGCECCGQPHNFWEKTQ